MEEVIVKNGEFKQKLVGLINESGLPAFILKPTFKEIYEQLNVLEQQQYQEAVASKKEEEAKEDDLER